MTALTKNEVRSLKQTFGAAIVLSVISAAASAGFGYGMVRHQRQKDEIIARLKSEQMPGIEAAYKDELREKALPTRGQMQSLGPDNTTLDLGDIKIVYDPAVVRAGAEKKAERLYGNDRANYGIVTFGFALGSLACGGISAAAKYKIKHGNDDQAPAIPAEPAAANS